VTADNYAPPRTPLKEWPAPWSRQVPIRTRTRIAFVVGVVGVALLQGVFVYSPVVIPWSDGPVWGLLSAAVSVAGWLLIFSPAWLPMLVPQEYPRVSRSLFAVCGLLLLLVSCLVAFSETRMLLHGGISLLVPYGLLGSAIGVYFLWLAIVRTPQRESPP